MIGSLFYLNSDNLLGVYKLLENPVPWKKYEGCRVHHFVWGYGKIVSIKYENHKIVILFEKHGSIQRLIYNAFEIFFDNLIMLEKPSENFSKPTNKQIDPAYKKLPEDHPISSNLANDPLKQDNLHSPSYTVETAVVGVTFDNRQSVIRQLYVGEQVILRREPHNPFDQNAIRVERRDGQQIGFISRTEAVKYGPFLDNSGQPLLALVVAITGISLGLNLGVRIRFTLPG